MVLNILFFSEIGDALVRLACITKQLNLLLESITVCAIFMITVGRKLRFSLIIKSGK